MNRPQTRRSEGGRQALVNIKSASPAIPFDTPVTVMVQGIAVATVIKRRSWRRSGGLSLLHYLNV